MMAAAMGCARSAGLAVMPGGAAGPHQTRLAKQPQMKRQPRRRDRQTPGNVLRQLIIRMIARSPRAAENTYGRFNTLQFLGGFDEFRHDFQYMPCLARAKFLHYRVTIARRRDLV